MISRFRSLVRAPANGQCTTNLLIGGRALIQNDTKMVPYQQQYSIYHGQLWTSRRNISTAAANKQIKAGMQKFGDVIASTYGPTGHFSSLNVDSRNASKSALDIIKFVKFEDPLYEIGAEILKSAGLTVHELAGKGSKSAMLLTNVLANELLECKNDGLDMIEVEAAVHLCHKHVEKFLDKIKIYKLTVPGGGVALLYGARDLLDNFTAILPIHKRVKKIFAKSLMVLFYTLAKNGGVDGDFICRRLYEERTDFQLGYDFQARCFVNFKDAEILELLSVMEHVLSVSVRTALYATRIDPQALLINGRLTFSPFFDNDKVVSHSMTELMTELKKKILDYWALIVGSVAIVSLEEILRHLAIKKKRPKSD